MWFSFFHSSYFLTEIQALVISGAGTAQWRDRSPPANVVGIRFRPGSIRKLVLLLVLALLRWFFSDSPVFLPPQKSTYPNPNPTRIGDPHENQVRLMCLPL